MSSLLGIRSLLSQHVSSPFARSALAGTASRRVIDLLPVRSVFTLRKTVSRLAVIPRQGTRKHSVLPRESRLGKPPQLLSARSAGPPGVNGPGRSRARLPSSRWASQTPLAMTFRNSSPVARTMRELEQSKAAVLNSLGSLQSRRSYQHAMDEFIAWYCRIEFHVGTLILTVSTRIFLLSWESQGLVESDLWN